MDKPSYYLMPAQPQGTPAIWNYNIMRKVSGRLGGLVKISLATGVALRMAELSPYPRGVKLGIMKQVADNKGITLRQMQILLSFAAQRALR